MGYFFPTKQIHGIKSDDLACGLRMRDDIQQCNNTSLSTDPEPSSEKKHESIYQGLLLG